MNLKNILLLLLLVGIAACSSDDDPGGGGGDSDDVFECKIDGQAYKITGTYAFADDIASDLFAIYGNEDPTQDTWQSVFVSLDGKPTVGTYSIDNGDMNGNVIINSPSGTVVYSSTLSTGTIEITEITSSRVKGTFEYVAKELNGSGSKTVTEGKFDVKIQ